MGQGPGVCRKNDSQNIRSGFRYFKGNLHSLEHTFPQCYHCYDFRTYLLNKSGVFGGSNYSFMIIAYATTCRQCFIQTPKHWGEITTAGGVDDRAPKARGRVAVDNETETPKASRGWGMGRGYPPPQPTRGSGERRELPSPQRGPGQSPGRKRIWCTLELSESHWWQSF